MDTTTDPHLRNFEQAYEAWRAAHRDACEAEERVVCCFDDPVPAAPLSTDQLEQARRLRSRAMQMHTAAMALAPDPR